MGTPLLVDSDAMAALCERVANNEQNSGGLTEQEVLDLVGPHTELCDPETVVSPANLTFLNPSTHRLGFNGVDTKAARCDMVREKRRINPAPLEPLPTYSGRGSLTSILRLDAWSDDTWVEWAWRAEVNIPAGAGWGFFTIPNLAGFQRPRITLEGTYRPESTTPQNDEPGGQGGDGAAPRGPFMGQEAHHWSSTQRIYMGFFRTDNNINRMFVEFRAHYTCL